MDSLEINSEIEIKEIPFLLLDHLLHFCYNPLHFQNVENKLLDDLLKLNEMYQISWLNDFISNRLAEIEPVTNKEPVNQNTSTVASSVLNSASKASSMFLTSAAIQSQMKPGRIF